MMIYKSHSAAETQKLARVFAKKIVRRQAPSAKLKNALVLSLSGELGSGKTTFTQGFLRGLGIRKRTTSPTFIVFRRFALRASRFANTYHVDAYRIKKISELAPLGLKEILRDPKNIVLIEWAENIKKVLPKNTPWLKFHHGKKANERIIKTSVPIFAK